MFLDYSTRSKTRSAEPYPVVKVPGPAEAGPTTAGQAEPSPSVPLVGDLRREGTDQGLDEVVDPRPSERLRDRDGVASSVATSGVGSGGWWRRGDSNS